MLRKKFSGWIVRKQFYREGGSQREWNFLGWILWGGGHSTLDEISTEFSVEGRVNFTEGEPDLPVLFENEQELFHT